MYWHVYIGTLIIMFLIICIAYQVQTKHTELKDHSTLLMDTPSGMVSTTGSKIATELNQIRDSLFTAQATQMTPATLSKMKNLTTRLDDFILQGVQSNPTDDALRLLDGINPDIFGNVQRSDVEVESYSTEDLVKLLCAKIDVAVELIKQGVCHTGRIDLEEYYALCRSLHISIGSEMGHSEHINIPNTIPTLNGIPMERVGVYSKFDESEENQWRNPFQRDAVGARNEFVYKQDLQPIKRFCSATCFNDDVLIQSTNGAI
jgi:hypothetical protein